MHSISSSRQPTWTTLEYPSDDTGLENITHQSPWKGYIVLIPSVGEDHQLQLSRYRITNYCQVECNNTLTMSSSGHPKAWRHVSNYFIQLVRGTQKIESFHDANFIGTGHSGYDDAYGATRDDENGITITNYKSLLSNHAPIKGWITVTVSVTVDSSYVYKICTSHCSWVRKFSTDFVNLNPSQCLVASWNTWNNFYSFIL